MAFYEDILNYVYKSLQEAGQKAQGMTEMSGRYAQGQQTPADTSSLLSTVMNTMGAPAGMVTPQAFEHAGPEAKQALESVRTTFPEMWNRIQQVPRELLTYVLPHQDMPVAGALGTLEHVNPVLDRMSLAQRIGSSGEPLPPELSTIIHELQHHLNADRFANMDPRDVATMGTLLHDVLPGRGQGSLNWRLGQMNQFVEPFENLQRGGGAGFRQPDLIRSVNAAVTRQGGSPGPEIPDWLSQAVGDEGLAHLAERTAYPGADPNLLNLANQLKVGTGAQPGSTLYGDVMQALGQLGQ